MAGRTALLAASLLLGATPPLAGTPVAASSLPGPLVAVSSLPGAAVSPLPGPPVAVSSLPGAAVSPLPGPSGAASPLTRPTGATSWLNGAAVRGTIAATPGHVTHDAAAGAAVASVRFRGGAAAGLVAPGSAAPAFGPPTFGARQLGAPQLGAPAFGAAGCVAGGEVRRPPVANWVRQRFPAARIAGLSTGSGVTVAVIDSGVDAKHPLLAGRVAHGRDYLDRGGDGSRDCVGHGTAVASIIAGAASSDAAFQGLAPRARILPVRISEQQWVAGARTGRTVPPAVFAQAIRWAVDHGAAVLNLSVVLSADHAEVRAAVQHAVDADVVVVAAAGNQGEHGSPRPYPASYPGVIGVGAVGPDGARLPFSQIGPYVDLVAPGADVPAAGPAGRVGQFSGTSYATPFVAATAALLRAAHPERHSADVIRRLLATADPAPGARDAGYGAGIVNPYRALAETIATGEPIAAAPLPPPTTDPVALAAQAREQHTRSHALWLAIGATAAAAIVLLLAAVAPHGNRRRWRVPTRP